MWTGFSVGVLCICSVLAYCRPCLIKVLNKGLYYAVCRERCCDVLSLGINYTLESFGVSKCSKSAKCMQMWPSLFHTCFRFEQQPAAKIRRVLHVLSLRNLSNHAVTSNLLITFLCPKCSVAAGPTSVPYSWLCAQQYVFVFVFVSVSWLFTVGCHSYFTFSRPQLLSCIF